MTITEFLLARIDEDEKLALRVTPGRVADSAHNHWIAHSLEFEGVHDRETTRHIVHWDPHRVLAECKAKRVIAAEHQATFTDTWCDTCEVHMPCTTAHALASVYADHPDYDPAWEPKP